LRRAVAAFACAFAALFLTGPAAGVVRYGVTEDAGKYAADGGGTFFSELNDVGLTENAITIYWDPSLPGGMAEPGLLDRVLPQARARGIRVVLAVYALRPRMFTTSPTAEAQYVAFLQRLARTYPQLTDFVVGNEPNQPRYWQPQFSPDGSDAAATGYAELLARCYDALKSVNPAIRVLGFGLSQRGNDDPRAPSNASHSPVRFIHDVGAAYYASGRTRPLMDALAFHPYPGSSVDPLEKGLAWPNASVANLDRIKQAVWDAFHGTAQSTFENGLGLAITEVGWQVGVAPGSAGAYTGAENVPTTDEPTQAAIYAKIVQQLGCDPSVTDVLFLHLIDETDLSGFQSGLVRADGTRRASYDAVRDAVAATRGLCAGPKVVWRHATGVVGAAVDLGGTRRRALARRARAAVATAAEGAVALAGAVRIGSSGTIGRAAVERALLQGSVDVAETAVPANGRTSVRLPAAPAAPGVYAYAVVLQAELNPQRRTTFVGRAFRVG
jgi:hypothetical protein